MVRGTAVVTIDCSPDVVFDIVTDVSRTGEWSTECIGGSWVPPAQGPAVDAEFLGHNVAKLGAIPLKKWTTTSTVTACEPGKVFEFVAAGYTHWRYEFIGIDAATRVTETFWHEPYTGFQAFLYGRVFKRTRSMIAGMEKSLAALKAVVEADARCSASETPL